MEKTKNFWPLLVMLLASLPAFGADKPNVPRVYNLITDPKEEYNMASAATWVLPVMFKKIIGFQATLAEEPPIPLGMPDPYVPPKK